MRETVEIDANQLGIWDPLDPVDVVSLFHDFPSPWWIAGGWAIELFVGEAIRSHGDIDVEIPRCAANELAAALSGWETHLAAGGRLEPWDLDHRIPSHVNSLWCRANGETSWQLQVMLAKTSGDDWVYRRDTRIRRPLNDVMVITESGFPVLAPEVQFLFRSKAPREKDDVDILATLEQLNARQRTWLVESLDLVSPGHPWISVVGAQKTVD